MKHARMTLFLSFLLAIAGLVACQAAAGLEALPTAASYTDPFAYCAAVGTIDAPGAPYTGPAVPESVAQGLQQALDVPDMPLNVLQGGSSWRCMNGAVYACFVGANLPCDAKANTERTPTQAEIDFCQDNPDSEFIPAAVTGRETVFEWRCRNGDPAIVQQIYQPDEQGFLAGIWYQLAPAEGASAIANPASQYCVEQGYQWEVRDEAGGQVGYCLFPDGSECEEWAYYRGECSP